MPAIVHYQRSAVDLDQMFRSSGAHQTRPSASGAIRDFHHGLLGYFETEAPVKAFL
jgi:hypothetical protein